MQRTHLYLDVLGRDYDELTKSEASNYWCLGDGRKPASLCVSTHHLLDGIIGNMEGVLCVASAVAVVIHFHPTQEHHRSKP